MIFRSPAMRLSISLVLLMANFLFFAKMLGFIPDKSKAAMEVRKGLSESLALMFCAAAQKGDTRMIQTTLRSVVERNTDIRSAAIRGQNGKLMAVQGEHLKYWQPAPDGKSTPTHIRIPLFLKDKNWATMEISFRPLWSDSLAGGFSHSFLGLISFMTLACLVSYFMLLKKALRELDPAGVIPARVQNAFNALKEGVLILDENEQIVMANKSFAALMEKPPEKMMGLKGSELGWLDYKTPQQIEQLPWIRAMGGGDGQQSGLLSLMGRSGSRIKLAVHASNVGGRPGKSRGALVTFDDITELEEKNFELNTMVGKLKEANEEIQGKTRKLEFLANRDPMTGCLNRRAFGRQFERLFLLARQGNHHLCCLMTDIDFFKKVNDNYGHATGDEVIKGVANVLKTSSRDTDLAGRYGGEEFCMVFPGLSVDKTVHIAERIRKTIKKQTFDGVSVTVSLGISSVHFNAARPEELIDQADKALYVAKESGRNRVVIWGRDMDQPEPVTPVPAPAETNPPDEAAPKHRDPDRLNQRIMELEGLLKKRTLELEHFKMFDAKTGLPTQTLFEDRITREIARSRRLGTLISVVSVTIETISRIHETLGQKAAEQLVKACGQRLDDVLRKNIDTTAVIKLKKKERAASLSLISQTRFGILLTDIKRVDHVTWIMKRMLDSFKKPFVIQGNEIYASAFLGVSLFPHDGETAQALHTSAANANRHARKNKGQNRYLFASKSLNDITVEKLKIESYLHKALKNDELQLYYQPKVNAASMQISGFEALTRWESPDLGAVPPDRFIEIAEESGLINEIGDWVLVMACRQIRTWLDMGLDVPPLAINVSGAQLARKDFPKRIRSVLKTFDLDTDHLEIELTETTVVNSTDKSFAMLKKIGKMGIRISMDDFGTGYSSFAYLKDIPLSCLKIDKSFIFDIKKEENVDKLVGSMVSIAHVMGLEVVAEGVEEEHQAEYLRSIGCEYFQGYLFSRPVPEEAVVEMLSERQHLEISTCG